MRVFCWAQNDICVLILYGYKLLWAGSLAVHVFFAVGLRY